MGTLGCINDMMRRDKENRELRNSLPYEPSFRIISHLSNGKGCGITVLDFAVGISGYDASISILSPSFSLPRT